MSWRDRLARCDFDPNANSAESIVRSVSRANGTNGTIGNWQNRLRAIQIDQVSPQVPQATSANTPDTVQDHPVIADMDFPIEWIDGVRQLDPELPPAMVPPTRWRQFVSDGKLFLDRWGSTAAKLGWSADDLFAADAHRPFERLDQAGLIWLLNGRRVRALTENTASIETHGGAEQVWRRRSAQVGRCRAWHLHRETKLKESDI
jgi:hypothetical protein